MSIKYKDSSRNNTNWIAKAITRLPSLVLDALEKVSYDPRYKGSPPLSDGKLTYNHNSFLNKYFVRPSEVILHSNLITIVSNRLCDSSRSNQSKVEERHCFNRTHSLHRNNLLIQMTCTLDSNLNQGLYQEPSAEQPTYCHAICKYKHNSLSDSSMIPNVGEMEPWRTASLSLPTPALIWPRPTTMASQTLRIKNSSNWTELNQQYHRLQPQSSNAQNFDQFLLRRNHWGNSNFFN